jgi:hypothetical protein
MIYFKNIIEEKDDQATIPQLFSSILSIINEDFEQLRELTYYTEEHLNGILIIIINIKKKKKCINNN